MRVLFNPPMSATLRGTRGNEGVITPTNVRGFEEQGEARVLSNPPMSVAFWEEQGETRVLSNPPMSATLGDRGEMRVLCNPPMSVTLGVQEK